MTKKKKSADKKAKKDIEKLAKEINGAVDPAIDLENPEEDSVAASGEIDLAAEVAEYKDKYLRLYSEFENYRRRTSKERLELISTANSGLMKALIPIADDFDRALKAGTEGAVEGVELIFNKFKNTLEGKGLKKWKRLQEMILTRISMRQSLKYPHLIKV